MLIRKSWFESVRESCCLFIYFLFVRKKVDMTVDSIGWKSRAFIVQKRFGVAVFLQHTDMNNVIILLLLLVISSFNSSNLSSSSSKFKSTNLVKSNQYA